MFIIADLIVILVLIGCIYIGYKRGLTQSLIRILSFAIAVCIAFMLFKPVSNIVIDSTNFDENIQTTIAEVFEKEDSNNEKQAETSPILEHVSNEVEKATAEKKHEIVRTSADKLSRNIISILVFIALFLIARIALNFVKALANLLTKLPLLKQCDKIGGEVYGAAEGLLIIFITLALITLISTIVNRYEILEIINKSYITKYLNDYNILLKVIF